MKISWSSEDYENEGEIIRCVLVNGAINILFKAMDDGGLVQGRISLKPISDEQSTTGYWYYPDAKTENPLSGTSPLDFEEIEIRATVTGKLQNFRGKKIEFVGMWDETEWDKEDGDKCDFEIEAYIEE